MEKKFLCMTNMGRFESYTGFAAIHGCASWLQKNGLRRYNGRCMSEGRGLHQYVTGQNYAYWSLLEKSSTIYTEKLSFSIVCGTTDKKNSPKPL